MVILSKELNSAKKVILITGGDGFIGGGLLNYFSELNGYYVIASSRKFHSSKSKDFIFLPNLDVDHSDGWIEALRGVDCVVHCAAKYHIKNEANLDLLSICRKINVAGTMRLAKLAVAAGVKRFIFLSSLKVNGEISPVRMPFNENDPPNPTYPYGISKYEAEQALLAFGRESGLEIVIIRPPPVYGPRVKANFLAMMKFLNLRIPMPLAGIHNLRSYIGVNNLFDFIHVCIEHPKAAGEIFLVSDDDDLSTTQLLNQMGIALGKLPILFSLPKKLLTSAANMTGKKYIPELLFSNFQADISKARNVLDWHPIFTVEEGMQKTAVDFLRRS